MALVLGASNCHPGLGRAPTHLLEVAVLSWVRGDLHPVLLLGAEMHWVYKLYYWVWQYQLFLLEQEDSWGTQLML